MKVLVPGCKKLCPLRLLKLAFKHDSRQRTDEANFENVIDDHLLARILEMLSERDLLVNAALTNKRWCRVAYGSDMWRYKTVPHLPEELIQELDAQAAMSKSIWARAFYAYFQTNLLVNPYLQDYLGRRCGWGECVVNNWIETLCIVKGDINGWKFPRTGGDGWQFEDPPIGLTENLPPAPLKPWLQPCCVPLRHPCACASSYSTCIASQRIDLMQQLEDRGLSRDAAAAFLDFGPPIGISIWMAGRIDCDSICQMKVQLMDDEQQQIMQWRTPQLNTVRGKWRQVVALIDQYPAGMRYIDFDVAGRDIQFRKGWYGAKFACPEVHFVAPQQLEDYRNRSSTFCKNQVAIDAENGMLCKTYDSFQLLRLLYWEA